MSNYFNASDTYDWLDPAPIYDAIATAGGVMTAILPMIITVVFFTRYFQESAKQLTGRARFSEAAGGAVLGLVLLLTYAAAGFLLLKFFLAVADYFYKYGSFSLVAGDFNKLYQVLQSKADNYDSSMFEIVLDTIISLGAGPLSFMFFQINSFLMLLLLSFMRVGYAMYFGIVYLWGFVAIPTKGLSGVLDISNGWTRSAVALFIWPIMEAILLIFMKALMAGIIVKMSSIQGTDMSVFVIMHLVMGLVCILLMVVMIAAPFITMKLAMNQEALSGLVMPLVGGALYAGHQMQQVFKKSETMPTLEGERHRDGLARTLSNVNQHPIGSLVGAVKGLGNAITNSKKQGNE